MWVSILNTIPTRVNLPGQNGSGPAPGPTGDFMALESGLSFIVLLESGGKIELED